MLTEQQIIELNLAIGIGFPDQPHDDRWSAAWIEQILGDLEYAECIEAITRWARAGHKVCSVGKVRSLVLEARYKRRRQTLREEDPVEVAPAEVRDAILARSDVRGRIAAAKEAMRQREARRG